MENTDNGIYLLLSAVFCSFLSLDDNKLSWEIYFCALLIA